MAIEFTEFLARILTAVILGGVVGVEREYHKRPAGVLTLPLVALGSALMTIISFSVPGVPDPTRIAAGIATGIGFIGAGSILKIKDNVRGITTAAAIWVVAALGMAAGFGMYIEAIATTAIVVLIVFIGFPLKDYLETRPDFKHVKGKNW
ncbi:MgtC family protein [uncultured archaeon]|nr:MgtC family protein [uncultured archaeon]